MVLLVSPCTACDPLLKHRLQSLLRAQGIGDRIFILDDAIWPTVSLFAWSFLISCVTRYFGSRCVASHCNGQVYLLTLRDVPTTATTPPSLVEISCGASAVSRVVWCSVSPESCGQRKQRK